MRSLVITSFIAALLCLAGIAHATEVEVVLTGGEVVGKVRGRGTAHVEAEVRNLGVRELQGIQIACFYVTADIYPDELAQWQIHEFMFDPPLGAGRKTRLSFTDENAAEYILIELRQALFDEGLSYNGAVAELEYGLQLIDGVSYIAARDLINVIGGGISYDRATTEIVLLRSGSELRFKEDSQEVALNGLAGKLNNTVVVVDGRSFVPLLEFCGLLGIATEINPGLGLILLSDE